MSVKKKILVIAPHMDDEVLGMGGTIAKHVQNNDSVFVCFVANRIYCGKFEDEKNKREIKHALAAKAQLGYKEAEFMNLNDERLDVSIQDIIKPLEEYIEKVKPDIVYSNFYGDNHQDHRAVFQAMRVVIRPFAKVFVPEWHLYETPSSTDQSPPIMDAAFLANHFVDISATFETKMMAYRCYETEKRLAPHPRSEKAIEVLAQKRGHEIGFHMAEAFRTMRSSWN